MKKQVLLICVSGLFAVTSCNVHQWPDFMEEPEIPVVPDNPEPDTPEDPGIDDPTPEEKRTVTLSLTYLTDFYTWEHNYDPILGRVEEANPDANIHEGYPGTTSKYDNTLFSGILFTDAKVYRTGDMDNCVSQHTFTTNIDGSGYDSSISIELPDGESYDIVLWSHLLTHSEANPYYDSSDFYSIKLIDNNYEANTDYRDGFRGRISINESRTEENYTVTMRRPMGKFELVTTDLSEFLDHETTRRALSSRATADEYKVVISYSGYYPNSYKAISDNLENSVTGKSFNTGLIVTGENEASMGFDYVFVNNTSNGGVDARVDVYDNNGVHVAGSTVTITVPLRRDHHTVLRGAFLSMDGNGGVGIDPDFKGDHNVTVP